MHETETRLSQSTSWRQVLIVCRKCGKKLKGGFGDQHDESLKSVLRRSLRDAGRRRDVRVMETSCLGVCPKRGVTALNASDPGILHVIPAGTVGDEAMRTLLSTRPFDLPTLSRS